MKKEKMKGITLIALVITIIVLLILAGVTIAAISGNEGVLQKAQTAKDKTEIANAKEQAQILAVGYLQDYYTGRYVTGGVTAANEGEYVLDRFSNTPTYGNYKFSVEGNTLKVYNSNNIFLVEGDIEEDGTITWSDTTSGEDLTPTPVTPTGVTITNNTGKTTITTAENLSLSASISPSGAEGTITWSCSPAGAVTFSSATGASTTVTPVSTGNVTITASTGSINSTGLAITINQTPAEIAATVNSKIGKQVNYTVSAYSKPWRVFYADENYVFLITTDNALSGHALGTYPLDNTKAGAYSNAFGVSSYGQTYNSVWWGKMSTPSSNERANAKATAYLCDSNNWTSYAGGTFTVGTTQTAAPTGTIAVGGPTKELLIKSWNAAYANSSTVSGAPSGTATQFTANDGNVTEVGYAYDKPDELRKDSSNNGLITTSIVPLTYENTSYGLYNPLGTSGNSYWLASPSSSNGYDVCSVSYYGYVSASAYYDTSLGVRPLVCIPTSSFDTSTIVD